MHLYSPANCRCACHAASESYVVQFHYWSDHYVFFFQLDMHCQRCRSCPQRHEDSEPVPNRRGRRNRSADAARNWIPVEAERNVGRYCCLPRRPGKSSPSLITWVGQRVPTYLSYLARTDTRHTRPVKTCRSRGPARQPSSSTDGTRSD